MSIWKVLAVLTLVALMAIGYKRYKESKADEWMLVVETPFGTQIVEGFKSEEACYQHAEEQFPGLVRGCYYFVQ